MSRTGESKKIGEDRRAEGRRGDERREAKMPVRRPESKWEDNINIYLTEIVSEWMDLY